MREALFVFLYGALFLTGLFLAPFWGFLARRRYKRIAGRWIASTDRYYVLAAAICVLCIGDTFVFGARTAGNIQFGLSPILRSGWDAVAIGIGLAIVMIGKLMLVWLADLEKEPPVWTWTRWLVVATCLWAVAAAALQVLQ
jgi:hypothetical protein